MPVQAGQQSIRLVPSTVSLTSELLMNRIFSYSSSVLPSCLLTVSRGGKGCPFLLCSSSIVCVKLSIAMRALFFRCSLRYSSNSMSYQVRSLSYEPSKRLLPKRAEPATDPVIDGWTWKSLLPATPASEHLQSKNSYLPLMSGFFKIPPSLQCNVYAP